MFNINNEVQRLEQLQYAKIHSIPDKPKIKDTAVPHIDSMLYEIQAEQEGHAILEQRKNRVHTPRVKTTYNVDGNVFRHGFKKRKLDGIR